MSAVSWLTFTHVAPFVVYAMTTIFARVLFAFIHILAAALTLPTSRTSTGIGGIICRWTAHSSFLTWMGSTGNLLLLTVFTCEWWTTLAGVTVDAIHTNALVQTGTRCTFIYVLLTVHTSESKLALTSVPIMPVHTGAIILAWT